MWQPAGDPKGKGKKKESKKGKKHQGKKHEDSESAPPSNPYNIPLYYAAPEVGDPDYEALAKLNMTEFAVSVCEEKIREFYAEACHETIVFHRHLAHSSRTAAYDLQSEYDRHMRELAESKKADWTVALETEAARRRSFDALRARGFMNVGEYSPRPRQHRASAAKTGLGRSEAMKRKGSGAFATKTQDKASKPQTKGFMARFKTKRNAEDEDEDEGYASGNVSPIVFA